MISFFSSILVTFSMFSKIPMPRVEWNENNLKYVYSHLPMVGLLVGGIQWLWYTLALYLGLDIVLYAATAVVIPIVVTGGIHLDGFIDSCDAMASYADREKRLEILSDPNTGAFGVIYSAVYSLMSLGVYAQLYRTDFSPLLFLCVFVLGRGVASALGAWGRSAKSDGLKKTFSAKRTMGIEKAVIIFWLVASVGLMFWVSPLVAAISLVAMLAYLLFFCGYVAKNFGGFTGDLLGFSICICELIVLIAMVIGGLL